MSRSILSALIIVTFASRSAFAQPDPSDPTPLTVKTYAYPSGIPYQVDPVNGVRGPQTGYNICNSTTENQQSLCQTSFVNNIDDFCLWAPPMPNSTIGVTEGEEVAWCSKHGHGTRVMPAGALTGVQLLVTPQYYQLAGFINQASLNMAPDDEGGELDPHGADLRGNPIGGLMYSNAFPRLGADNNTIIQVTDWNSFMGGGAFCITICNPTSSANDQTAYCQNIYDTLGCGYNMPNNAQNGTFEICDADLKAPVGGNGYAPTLPASSNCQEFKSTDLYKGLATPTASATASPSGKTSGSSTSTGPPQQTSSSGASALCISAVASVLGTLFAVAFLS